MELETSPLSRVFFCCPSTIEHRLASAFSKNGIIYKTQLNLLNGIDKRRKKRIEIEKKEPKGTHFLVVKFDTYLFIKQQTQHICAAFWAATVSFGFVLSRKCTVNCLRKAFFFLCARYGVCSAVRASVSFAKPFSKMIVFFPWERLNGITSAFLFCLCVQYRFDSDCSAFLCVAKKAFQKFPVNAVLISAINKQTMN